MRIIVIGFIVVTVFLFLNGCSHNPIVDSRGKSSANIDGDMNRYHDDLYSCTDIAKTNTNEFINGTKEVYNKLRWRVLWLSPKLTTQKDMINRCLEGRGYVVLANG